MKHPGKHHQKAEVCLCPSKDTNVFDNGGSENGRVVVFSFAHACDLVHQVQYDVFSALLDIPEVRSACSNGRT